MAAIIPKMPEKVPAKKEFEAFLFISHPKKDPAPAIKTMNPTEIDKYFSDKFNNNKSQAGHPINRPKISGLTLDKSTSSFSL